MESDGDVLERYMYSPYGEVTVLHGANGTDPEVDGTTVKEFHVDNATDIDNPYLYTGRRFDPESGLFHYRARPYHAQLGRFLGRDPWGYGAGDMNLYAYVGGRPMNAVDPSGNKTCVVRAPMVEDTAKERFYNIWGTYPPPRNRESRAKFIRLWGEYGAEIPEDDPSSIELFAEATASVETGITYEGVSPGEGGVGWVQMWITRFIEHGEINMKNTAKAKCKWCKVKNSCVIEAGAGGKETFNENTTILGLGTNYGVGSYVKGDAATNGKSVTYYLGWSAVGGAHVELDASISKTSDGGARGGIGFTLIKKESERTAGNDTKVIVTCECLDRNKK